MHHPQHAAPRRRRRWLIPLLLAAVLALALWDSNCRISVEPYTVPLSRLPAAFDGLRIVQLTDLQGRVFGSDNRKLLEAVERAEPDLIFLTGDVVDSDRETPIQYGIDLGRRLAAIAPTYFVTGNHEWALGGVRELKDGLREAGVTVLSNQFLPLEREGETLIIAGIDDPNGPYDQKTPEALAAEVQAAWPHTCWLLLAHRNDSFHDRYSLLGADLVVAGHGHGGVIRVPFLGGLFGHHHDLFPGYVDGLYTENGSILFVSRGLGNTGWTLRLNNRPQLAVLTLTTD